MAKGLMEPPGPEEIMLPPGSFDGKVVMITGGGTGLGLAMGHAFARLGATIAICSRNPDNRVRGIAEIEAIGGKAVGVELDIRDREAVTLCFEQIEERAGPVDVLVNNAAGNFPIRADKISANAWRAVVQINLDGTFFCSQEFHARVTRRRVDGAILNILGNMIEGGAPLHSHAAAAKAGAKNLMQTLAAEWAPDGVRINGISPGLFPHSDHTTGMSSNRPDGYEAEWHRIPALRTGRLQEVGWAATYLCSPYAAFMTGNTIKLDGGDSLTYALRRPIFEPVRERMPE